ncbi:MAG: NAD(P)H-hydrate dehydratase [Candidatus Margulisbacteria bacterium]|nr:NAD(P)H-hydrate dehydratase [Candidatus Margulisiibacteriota bacterium]
MWKSKKHKLLVPRRANSHKGDYGRVLIVAGSEGMTGAAVLASRGAMRSGAGLTYLAVPKNLVNFVDSLTPEVITLPFNKIKTVNPDVVAIGPGLGVNRNTKKILSSLISDISSLIIDADALNVLANNFNLLKKSKSEIILTPHPGEMSRLIKMPTAFVQKNRTKVAKDLAAKLGVIVVLKGHATVVADAAGRVYINKTGNPGMASGGVGDVLTGMIAAFKAQGLTAWQAATVGVQVHGLAGDLAAKESGQPGLIASDLVEKIPYAIQKNY